MAPSSDLHLAVALDGAGWHPAAWRDLHARPSELFSPRYWVDLAREAERGTLDFVTIEDSLAIQSGRRGVVDARTDRVRGRLDAVLIAARIAPTTSALGLVPVATTTHTEPFHVSKAIATLDYVSNGRAGFQARVSATALEAGQFGRRGVPDVVEGEGRLDQGSDFVTDLFDEAADFIEVVRRLWDSWEDDAEIRDATTGRFIDRDRLHYIDFEGRWFSVKGPSITPRPPQGQPLVTVLAHVPVAFRLAARGADVVFTTPHSAPEAHAIVTEVRGHERDVDREGPPLRVFADLVVFLGPDAAAARTRKARLDELDGGAYRSDAAVFTGTPGELADVLTEWHASGIDGFRLRPGTIPHDLEAVTRDLVDLLDRRGVFPRRYDDSTLRGRLGLPRPHNRYAAVGATRHGATP
ncbi:MAG: LLM class flavin-dependent oxidoreductase [Acidimicrobiales bacterium]|jgi:alkanesulfonate monooxygenase SsuD/methylene tetrahydromethanopterin reductase-like flavin-dependent oxidoreductase (luciferase family)